MWGVRGKLAGMLYRRKRHVLRVQRGLMLLRVTRFLFHRCVLAASNSRVVPY